MIDIAPTALAHHAWANVRLLETCSVLTDEELATETPGTFGSVLDTLRHVIGADAAYLTLLTDGAVPEIDESSMDVAALREVAEAHAEHYALLARTSAPADRQLTRHNPDGDSSAPLAVRLVQVAHHGTEHRSQVCTTLTQLGVEPPEIDVWAWADEHRLLTWEPRQG